VSISDLPQWQKDLLSGFSQALDVIQKPCFLFPNASLDGAFSIRGTRRPTATGIGELETVSCDPVTEHGLAGAWEPDASCMTAAMPVYRTIRTPSTAASSE
jgi:hypothetical protein